MLDNEDAATVMPDHLAPAGMFVTLLKVFIGFYILNTFYNLVTFALAPQGSIWQIVAPAFAALVLFITKWCVVRGRMQAGAIALAVTISVYDLLAYPLGFVPYYWALWNQALLLALLMPFTTRRVFRCVVWLTIFVAAALSVAIFVQTQAHASAAALSAFMHDFVIGLTMIMIAWVMYRVQGILMAGQASEWSARIALIETQKNLESMIHERTQALTEANQKLSRQNALLTNLHETRVSILDHLELQELMASILQNTLELLDAQVSEIHLATVEDPQTEWYMRSPQLQLMPSEQVTLGKGLMGRVWQSGQVMVMDDYSAWEHRDPGAQYDVFHACIAVPLMTDGKVMGVMAAIRTTPGRPFSPDEADVQVRLAQIASVAYDNARLYARLRASEQLLETRVEERTRSLQHALEENEALREKSIADAGAAERSRLARELHDSVSQAIYGISLGTRAAQKIRQTGKGDLDQPLDYIVSLSEMALAEIRALIFEMKPESLREEGLMAAIYKHAEVLRHRHNNLVKVQLPEVEPAAALDVKFALYRIMQEATHNIIKHAHARNIIIELQDDIELLRLSVRDDGRGFVVGGKRPGHHGLDNMAERIQNVGGRFEIESTPGKGTRLCVTAPKRADAVIAAPPEQRVD